MQGEYLQQSPGVATKYSKWCCRVQTQYGQ